MTDMEKGIFQADEYHLTANSRRSLFDRVQKMPFEIAGRNGLLEKIAYPSMATLIEQ